jgi:hypothetical protein
MQHHGTPRKRVSLRGFALGFLCLLAVIPRVQAQAETSAGQVVICPSAALSLTASNLSLTQPAETGVPGDLGNALEDSVELFRVDGQQRTCVLDPPLIEPKAAAKAVPNWQPNISPPLLV